LSLSPILTSLFPGLFLCVSYGFGFTDRLFGTEEQERLWNKGKTPPGSENSGNGWASGARGLKELFGRLPLVLLPEWPLPMEFFSPEVSTLALITNPHPFPPSSSSAYDFALKSWEILGGENYGTSSTPHNKMIVSYKIKSIGLSAC
jgi:hypothetical protein